MKVSFLQRNEAQFKEFGHLVEGIQHFTNDPELNKLEENRMLVMLDNAAQGFACEKKFRDFEHVKEAMTLSTDAATFVKIQMPLIRKVYPQMITREFTSVQPMAQPTTKLFYYDLVREDGTSLSTNIDANKNYSDNEEYDPNDPQAIKEISLKITDSTVSAVIKKLKARHTVESEQDIMAYHGISVENDLTNALSSQIAREWDRVILADMYTNATGGAATFDQTIPAGISYTDKKVWMEGIYDAMIDVDNQIFKKRFVRTNFAICSPDIAAFISKMSGWRADDTGSQSKVIATGGRYFMGTLDSKWRIYVDPMQTSMRMLMGYNNPGDWLQTSFVFAPYILSYFSDTFLNPDTFVKTRAILSRAAYKTVVGDLLGIVTVSGS